MLMIQRTMTTINRKTTGSKRVLLLLTECVAMQVLCFNDSSTNGLQQPTRRLTSESVSSIRGSGGQQHDQNLVLFGIVCNICSNNNIITSPDTRIPGQNNIKCSTLDSMAQNKSLDRMQCQHLQSDTEITSLCCNSTTETTISPSTSQSPTSSSITSSPTATTLTPTASTSSSSSVTSPPVASPNSTSTTLSTTSDSKQGISAGAIVPIIIVVIILVVCAVGDGRPRYSEWA